MKKKRIVLPKGVIKIKPGYNPNSSSIGTVIYSFPLVYIVLSTIAALLTALLTSKKKNRNE